MPDLLTDAFISRRAQTARLRMICAYRRPESFQIRFWVS